MQSKIKVAFFADVLEANVDGVTHTLYQMIDRIPKAEFDFLFITPHPPKDVDSFPFRIVKCPSMGLPLYSEYRIALPFFKKSLQDELESFNPDIVHFTTPSFLGSYARDFAKSRDIPVISTYHSHFHSYLEYYFGFLPGGHKAIVPVANRLLKIYRECDLTLVPSQAMKDFLLEWGVQPHQLQIWKRGVDQDVFSPSNRNETWRKEMGLEGKKSVLFVSRLVKYKSIDTIANTYELFRERNPNVEFVITGDGPDADYLKEKMPEAIFTGKKTDEELAMIYASNDVFMFPSVTETFGNVVLEALASGLPVVAAAEGGPLDIVTDEINGYLVTPRDAEAFYQKLNLLLNNDVLRNRMSQEAVAYADTQSWDNIAKQLFSMYEQKVERKLAYA